MRKKILTMSIAAVLTAATSSSVMAFDSIAPSSELTTPENCVADLVDGDGRDDIVVYGGKLHNLASSSRLGAYRTPLKVAASPLEMEPEGRGDALIYPLYKAKDGWETEIIVRNTDSKHAIVAKASLRIKTDSLEVFDFNIYLSADDVARFTIREYKKGKGGIEIYSEDGSILRRIPNPYGGGNDVSKDDFASKDKPFIVNSDVQGRLITDNGALVGKREDGTLTSIDTGYVVIFGMGEAKGNNDDKNENRYHDDHVRLFSHYRKELDVCRSPWRVGHGKAMLNGTFIRNTIISTGLYSKNVNFSIPAPNQEEKCVPASNDDVAGNYFGDVNKPIIRADYSKYYKNGLTGTVRLYTATDKDGNATRDATRDMILPAVAIRNFTDENKIIYTEGEVAALQDRRIAATGNPVPPSADVITHSAGSLDAIEHPAHVWAEYYEGDATGKNGICEDATAFHINRTTYTFDAESVANQIIVTQPYKRILVQMGNDDRYWQDVTLPAYKPPVYDADGKLTNKGHFGGFSSFYNVYNEHEKMSNIPYTFSPHNSDSKLRPELASMPNLERCTEFSAPPAAGEESCRNEADLDSDRKDVHGFARIWFTNEAGQRKPFPAIVTQMVGSTINIGAKDSPVLVPELNWIYSQFRKTVD